MRIAVEELFRTVQVSIVAVRWLCPYLYPEGRPKKNKRNTTRFCLSGSEKATDRLFLFFFIFLLRFWVFLGMRNPETAKKLFWIFLEFFGHDPKSHLMTQKNIFFRYLFRTSPAILRPLQTPYAPGGTSKPLKSAWGVFLRKSKIDPKSAFSAGGGKGALAAWGSHMRLVSTK